MLYNGIFRFNFTRIAFYSLKDYNQKNRSSLLERLHDQNIILGSFKDPTRIDVHSEKAHIELPIISLNNFENCGIIKAPSSIFSIDNIRYDLMHLENRRILAERRRGIACSKQRGEVKGSRRKIHPQKGTGKARAGSSRAPHRRKGGRAFGVKPRNFRIKLPRKVRRLAFCSILSTRFKEKSIFIFEEDDKLFHDSSKTKEIYKSSIGNLIPYGTLLIHSCITDIPFFRITRSLKGLRVKALFDKKLPAISDFLESKYILLSTVALDNLIKTIDRT